MSLETRRRAGAAAVCALTFTALLASACGSQSAGEADATNFVTVLGLDGFASSSEGFESLEDYASAVDLVATGTLTAITVDAVSLPIEDPDDPAHHEMRFLSLHITVQEILRGELDNPDRQVRLPLPEGLTDVDELAKLLPDSGIDVVFLAFDSSNRVEGVLPGDYVVPDDIGLIFSGTDGEPLILGASLHEASPYPALQRASSFEAAVDTIRSAARS